MKKPMVYLIGAGPGDPWLITARGLRYLRVADVVLYDHLVHPRILRYGRADAERIDVGPAAPEAMEQEAICYLLAEKAREGKVVARLKWGDPFVFDRGGEEALFLHLQGVPFEVVPGIPAAIGVPAYAGIPITYPGGGDTVTFVRGHEGEGHKRPPIDWTSLARLGGTVVCYAGPRQISGILDALLTHGWSGSDPAALVFRGTLPEQETHQGTIEQMVEVARRPGGHDPAILIVGRVTGLREHLRWFDARPLFGKRIVVTRPREQAGEFVEQLEALGATVVEAPTIRIAPPEDYAPLDEACANAGSFDWIVFTSVNGVDYFMQRLLLGPGDVRDLRGVRVCAIGPGTADRLRRHGIKVDVMPPEFRTEAVLDALHGAGPLDGKRVLLPRADIARELLAEQLRKSGAVVTEVTAYRSVPVEVNDPAEPDIYRMLLDKKIDVVTFTSPSTVQNFARLYGKDQAADLLNSTIVASIGPVTAEAAEQGGIHTSIMPAEYTIPGLVRAIVEHFEQQRTTRAAVV
ncbi:MAG: uroporphyrinogen-III C-methyltransferase [Acidobacteria bacterium]|nr:uroporphyrinogen-III C-methyltransferase [Acidobacteriota bacterium]